METYFEVKNFRGFEHLVLEQFKLVNLVSGPNNIGKTSLLEAIFTHSAPKNIEVMLRTDAWRGLPGFELQAGGSAYGILEPSFYQMNLSRSLEFISKDKYGNKRQSKLTASGLGTIELTAPSKITRQAEMGPTGSAVSKGLSSGRSINIGHWEYQEQEKQSRYEIWLDQRGPEIVLRVEPSPALPAFQCIFLTPRAGLNPFEDAIRYSNLRRKGKETLVLDALRILDSSIEKLEVLTLVGAPILHVSWDSGRPLPLPLLGDGAVQLVRIILAIGEAEKGVVLVDEIGYGFHYSVQEDLWRIICGAAEMFNTQIFATTHSFETITAAHKVFSEKGNCENFQYFRLDKVENRIQPVYYDKEQLETAVNRGFEIR